MSSNYDNILVVDLELTCWENEKPPEGESRDIIQVGFVTLNAISGEISAPRDYLVRPERSRVSNFCVELTGITQKQVMKSGFTFEKVCQMLQSKWGSKNKAWAAFGRDAVIFQRQCQETGAPYPFAPDYLDVSGIYQALYGSRGMGLAALMAKEGIEFDGKAHTASADALGAAKLLWKTIEKARKD